MRVSKGKNKKLINAIENETEYIYMFKLNASNPIEKLLLSKVNSAMQEKNLTVRDAFLYVFSRSVEYGINSDTNIINENAANSINDNVNNNIITDKKEKKESDDDNDNNNSQSIIPPELQRQFDNFKNKSSDENKNDSSKSDNSAAIGNFLKKNFGTNY
uniref:hypothetical protein n=1 Tax=[Lactobacillus] rogosae TaxID=706562 RepID=UPI00402A66B6